MMDLRTRVVALAGCLTSTCLLLTPSAEAQLRVAPLVIEASANRGQAQGVIDVFNSGEATVAVEVYASPFTYDQTGFVELESDPSDLTPYLFFSPQQLLVDPGQQRRIRLSARLLPSLPDGEYRAVIFAQNQQPAAGRLDGVPVSITPRIGILFFVRKGNPSPDLVPQSAEIMATGQQIELLVDNRGGASIRPGIRWQLSQNGAEIESGETPKVVLIAGERRAVPIGYDDILPSGAYQIDGEIIHGAIAVPFSFDIIVP
ncbi:MAG: P pilus assembly protein, chaperone PapD [Elainellaceae cyanobacterium]